jgi:hypothetical protein
MDLSLKDLKAEVRKLRKEHCPPVSRLKKEALMKEHAHLASLGMKSPNMAHKEVAVAVSKEEVKKMPKFVRLVRSVAPMKERKVAVAVKEVKEEVKTVTKSGRKPSAYALFVKQHMKPGMSMKEVAELYKKSKK